jgi:hypothetical protein
MNASGNTEAKVTGYAVSGNLQGKRIGEYYDIINVQLNVASWSKKNEC